MRKLKLDTYETDDPTRENFAAIQDEIIDQTMRKAGWKFYEININRAYAGGVPITSSNTFLFRHNLKARPKDFIITSIRGAGIPTILYNETDDNFVYFTATDACIIRIFMGVYSEKKID